MPQRKQLNLYFLTPLLLEQKRKMSCFIIAMAHLALAFNLLGVYFKILPVFFLPLSALLYFIEKRRKKPLAAKNLELLKRRLYLHTACIILFILIMSIPNLQVGMLNAWSILIFILAPMSIYDALRTADGKNGLTLEILKVRS